MSEQTDIRDVLTELQNTPELVGGHRKKLEFCLRHFSSKGLTLATCADSKHLNRAVTTLQSYCREWQIKFSDYVPYNMRSPEERKRGPRSRA